MSDKGNEIPRTGSELHQAIIRSSPHPIFLVDVESRRIVEANPATAELLGYPLDEILLLDLYNIDLENRGAQDLMVRRVLENHHDILGERTFRRRDGTLIPVEASAVLVLTGGRKVLSIFARDISQKKEAEQESQRLQRALAFSQKHEAVGRLAAGIAHDFNNHLMVMLLCAQLVKKQLDPDDPNHLELEELQGAGKSAADLIRQLLAFSRKQVMRPRLVGMDQILHSLEKMVRRIIGEDVKLVMTYGAGEAMIFADQTQLEQVVLNLAVNARDAMPEGGTLTLSSSQVEVGEDFVEDYATLSAGPHVLLTIQDTGTGMSAETLDQIFEPFFTTKDQGKGTGLGLASVYGIVKQSNGSIWASSKVDIGTTFRIYLPVAEEGEEGLLETQIQDVGEDPTGYEVILLVEDDDMVRTITSRILRGVGYDVVEAGGYEEAMALFREADAEKEGPGIDMVLSDVVMPEKSGFDLVRDLSAIREDLKVIFMSGYSDEALTGAEAFSKRYLFLEKPLSRAELAQAIRQTLDS